MNISDILIGRYAAAGIGFTIKYDKDGNGRIQYIGFTPSGSADSDANWQIVKITYDVSNDPTQEVCTNQKANWTNRANFF